jgi:hypothetical protein
MGGAIVGRGRITTVRQDGGADTTHGSDDSEDSDEDIGPRGRSLRPRGRSLRSRGQSLRPTSVSIGSVYRPPLPQHNEPTRPPSVSECSGYRGEGSIPNSLRGQEEEV